MKVLIVGATGSIGRHGVRYALAAGHDVTALARDPARVVQQDDRLRVATGDVYDRESLLRATAGQDAVVSFLGTTKLRETTLRRDGNRNLVDAMRTQGVKRLVVMSALGVGDSKAEARRFSLFFMWVILPLLLRGHFRDMELMEEIVRASGLEWVIVRPASLIDEVVGEPALAVLDGTRRGKSVSKAALAAFMVAQLTDDTYVGKTPSLYGRPSPGR